jgi:hypothetical protein
MINKPSQHWDGIKQGNESFVVANGTDTVWKITKTEGEDRPAEVAERILRMQQGLSTLVEPAIARLRDRDVAVPQIHRSLLLEQGRVALEIEHVPGYHINDTTPEGKKYLSEWCKSANTMTLLKACHDCLDILEQGLYPDVNESNLVCTLDNGIAGITFLDTYTPFVLDLAQLTEAMPSSIHVLKMIFALWIPRFQHPSIVLETVMRSADTMTEVRLRNLQDKEVLDFLAQ